jgi:hypothetical protein
MLEVRPGEWAGYGLSATWVLDGICLSLCSHDMWNRSQLAVEVSLFSDDEISTELETIRHVSHPDHFRDHEGWRQREQKSSIRSGADPKSPLIWETDIELPNINCPKCTLQVVQFMADHGYNVPGGYSYHHCAALEITADPATPIDSRWPTSR